MRNKAREQGVDTSHVLFTDKGRAGLYFVEYGASPRSSKVTYDRQDSAISRLEKVPQWSQALQGCKWFHTSGITPALSDACADQVATSMRQAKQAGCTVSYDLNYRARLWNPEQARKVTARYTDTIDLCVGNEEDFQKVLGVEMADQEKSFDHIDIDYYIRLSKAVHERYGFPYIAISLRESHSVLRNGWKGLLYTGGKACISGHHELELIDRVGGGDSFSAGVIYGLFTGLSPQDTIDFAAAFSALKHTIWGDFNLVTLAEVKQYLKTGSARIDR
jgi:2-dehydro-3-deoxygluconokinase